MAERKRLMVALICGCCIADAAAHLYIHVLRLFTSWFTQKLC